MIRLFSHGMTLALRRGNVLKLSGDENEKGDDDNTDHANTVLTEVVDNSSSNQNNSNNNYAPHSYENQM